MKKPEDSDPLTDAGSWPAVRDLREQEDLKGRQSIVVAVCMLLAVFLILGMALVRGC